MHAPSLALASTENALIAERHSASAPTADALLRSADTALERAIRLVSPAEAPLLSNSGWGREWVRAGRPGAIARGAPPARCPAIGVALAGSRVDAIAEAVDRCRAGLEIAMAEDCACQLIALDDRLLAPLEAFARAPGTTGRLLGLGQAFAGPLVVREETIGPEPTDVRLSFATVRGELASARLAADGSATMTLADGRRFDGWRELDGWRRGRLTERLLLRGEDGRRVIALIGYEPSDFALDGAALARWPDAAPG